LRNFAKIFLETRKSVLLLESVACSIFEKSLFFPPFLWYTGLDITRDNWSEFYGEKTYAGGIR